MDWANKMLDDLRKGDRVLDIFGFTVTPGGGTGGGTGSGGSGHGTGSTSGTHTALTCLHIESLKARTPGYYSGTDTVGLSSRLWGKRNPN